MSPIADVLRRVMGTGPMDMMVLYDNGDEHVPWVEGVSGSGNQLVKQSNRLVLESTGPGDVAAVIDDPLPLHEWDAAIALLDQSFGPTTTVTWWAIAASSGKESGWNTYDARASHEYTHEQDPGAPFIVGANLADLSGPDDRFLRIHQRRSSGTATHRTWIYAVALVRWS